MPCSKNCTHAYRFYFENLPPVTTSPQNHFACSTLLHSETQFRTSEQRKEKRLTLKFSYLFIVNTGKGPEGFYSSHTTQKALVELKIWLVMNCTDNFSLLLYCEE